MLEAFTQRGAHIFSSRCLFLRWLIYRPARSFIVGGKKGQNASMAEHNAIKEKHTVTQTALVTDPKTTALSSVAVNTWARLQKLAHDCPGDCGGREQVYVRLNMSRCELGRLETQ